MIRRASALAFCGWAQQLSTLDTSESVPQRKGTAFHALTTYHYSPDNNAEKAALAVEASLSNEDLLEVRGWVDKLVASGWQPGRGAEWEMELLAGADGNAASIPAEAIYTGHPDVHWVQGDTLHLYDFKTGKHRLGAPEASLQLAAYLVPLARLTSAKRARIGFYWAREAEWQTCTLDAAGIDAAWERVRYAATLPAVPVVGPDCKKCWHWKFKRCRAPLDIAEAA